MIWLYRLMLLNIIALASLVVARQYYQLQLPM